MKLQKKKNVTLGLEKCQICCGLKLHIVNGQKNGYLKCFFRKKFQSWVSSPLGVKCYVFTVNCIDLALCIYCRVYIYMIPKAISDPGFLTRGRFTLFTFFLPREPPCPPPPPASCPRLVLFPEKRNRHQY